MVKSKKEIVEMVIDLRNRIEDKKNLIKKVIDLRDKAYAHKDPNATLTNVVSNEIHELVSFAGELHNSLNIAVFNTETRFDYADDWNIDFVLFHMNESRIKDQEEYLRKIGKLKDRESEG